VIFEIVEIFDKVTLKKLVVLPGPAGPGGPWVPGPDPPFTEQIQEVNHKRQIIDSDSVDGLITGAADTGIIESSIPKIRTREIIFFLIRSPLFNKDTDQECRK
jgi:hypothetical protein